MADEWTAPEVERSGPPTTDEERASLEAWLELHRMTLLHKCAGLTGEQLVSAACPPSNLTLLGLVRHMTEVERWWFRRHVDRQDLTMIYCHGWDDADFEELDAGRAKEDLDRFVEEIDQARAAAADHQLDEVVPSAGDHPERVRNIRWIYVHMIEEYARHNGHADLIREAIDGTKGE